MTNNIIKLNNSRFTVRQFIEALVGLHAQSHVALLAFETAFVPDLEVEIKLLEQKLSELRCIEQ